MTEWVLISPVDAAAEARLVAARIACHRDVPGAPGVLVPEEEVEEARRLLNGQGGGPDPGRSGVDGQAPPEVSARPPRGLGRARWAGWRRLASHQEPWQAWVGRWALAHDLRIGFAAGSSGALVAVAEPDEGEDALLVLHGSPDRGDGVGLPASIQLATKTFKLGEGQRRALVAPAMGAVIYDQSGAWPLVAVVDRTIYVLFRVHESISQKTFALMTELMRLAHPLLLRSAEDRRVSDQERAMVAYVAMRKRQARSELVRQQNESTNLDKQLRDLSQQMVEAERTRLQKAEYLKVLKGLVEREEGGMQEEFAAMSRLPHVRRVMARGQDLVICTDDLSYQDLLLGCFEITIKLQGGVEIRNLTLQKRWEGRIVDHPHVTDGDPCWGNIRNGIAQLIARGQYVELTQVILSFLQAVNEGDTYGKRIAAWRTVEGRDNGDR